MKVPGGANVTKSLVDLKKNLKKCLRQVNEQAGKLLSRGNYSQAESMVEVAKSLDALHAEVESLHMRWREIKGGRKGSVKAEQTPLWKYYKPILQALVELGGAANSAQLEVAVGQLMNGRFLEGDLETSASGKVRWQSMTRKARKHLVKEGLLEDDTGVEWRITLSGRKAAATETS